MTSPEAFASVGINTILHKVTEIEKHIAVMTCDLSALRKSTKETLTDLDVRLDVLEGDRWPWVKIGSGVAVLALIAAIIFGVLSQKTATTLDRPSPRPRPTAGP